MSAGLVNAILERDRVQSDLTRLLKKAFKDAQGDRDETIQRFNILLDENPTLASALHRAEAMAAAVQLFWGPKSNMES